MNYLRRFQVWQKLVALGVLGVVLAGVPFTISLTRINGELHEARLARQGIEPIQHMLRSLVLIARSRGLATQYLSGDDDSLAPLKAASAEAKAALDLVSKDKVFPESTLARTWKAITEQYPKLQASVEAHALSADESIAQHSALMQKITDIADDTADDFHLSLGSDPTRLHLINAAVIALPTLLNDLGKLRAGGVKALVRHTLSGDEKLKLATLLAKAEATHRDILNQMAKVSALDAGIAALVKKPIEDNENAYRVVPDLISRKIISATQWDADPDEYRESLTIAINKQVAFSDVALAALVGSLDKAIGAAANERMGLSIGLLLLLALVIGTSVMVSRSITAPLAEAVFAADAVATGWFDVEIDTRGKDEISKLTQSLSHVRGTVQQFIRALNTVARQHAEGFISQQIDPKPFLGEFQTVARDVNSLVKSHIDVTQRLVDTAGRYAIGDFAVNMDRLPNEQAALTETMDRVKSNLMAMNAEILGLVEAAKLGQLDRRGNSGKFQFGFREMVEKINDMLNAIVTPIQEVSRVLGAIAQGDLTIRIGNQFSGTFAKLADDTNSTVAQLTAIIGNIKHSTDAITVAASEIASGNADLSRRTEQEAANLQETASAMEEFTSAVKQTADNVIRANKLAANAVEVAASGGIVVEHFVETMAAIDASSKKISDIIGVIDGIAFQTNILALNASVEAARAGDQGRGFAVVATEVRDLAQRSANAAKEIKTLIGASVESVATGTTQVAQAGSTMANIVASVKEVTRVIGEISSATQEESSGIQHISGAITQIDQSTQQNAALVEEASAAATSLEDQAANLSNTVARFRVIPGGGGTQSDAAGTAFASPITDARAPEAAAEAVDATDPDAGTAEATPRRRGRKVAVGGAH